MAWTYLHAFKSYADVRPVLPQIAQNCVQETHKEPNNKGDTGIQRVGFFLMGTGRYIQLANQLVESMEKYFCTDKRVSVYVHYFVITDNTEWAPSISPVNLNRNYSIIYQRQVMWPQNTLNRFKIIARNFAEFGFSSFDYLYWLDADMKMVDHVCEDIFGDLVATMHPHYYMSNKEYPYESSNTRSRAYIDQRHRYEHSYYVGSFFGGSPLEMCKLIMTCHTNIQYDNTQLNGFVAKMHYESHLNRFEN